MIDFPNSPTLNQDYTVGTTTWTYDGAKWILKTYNSLHAVPVTAMMLWANTTYPTGWLLADGSAISRTTYADLFAAIGTTYGVGDGSSTFNIPSMPSAGSGSPNTIIKVTNSGALEPSAISHAANHTEGGSDVVTITGNQIANYQTYRNVIINGGMQVAQRGTSTASITTTGYYTADRWVQSMSALGTWTQTVVADAPTGSGFNNSLKVLCTTAAASPAAASYMLIAQNIEGYNVQHFLKGSASAKKFAVSFWVKSNVTGNFVLELNDTDNSRSCSAIYNIAASATWEKKTLIFPVDTTGAFTNDNNLSLEMNFFLDTGSNWDSGTLNTVWATNTTANRVVGGASVASAVNNYWQVTGVQLEASSAVTPFEFEPFETTLRKCQRYYYYLSSIQAYPLTQGIGFADGTTGGRTIVEFPTTMRGTPSIDRVSGVGLDDQIAYGSTATSVVLFGSRSTNKMASLALTGMTGLIDRRPYTFCSTGASGGYIGFTAEL